METKAEARFVRVSARKVRLLMDEVRGRKVGDARLMLTYAPQKAAKILKKVIDSAVANAEHNNHCDVDTLYVKKVYGNEGPTLKRWRPRAQGRATRIRKRTSHLTVILDEL